MLSTFTTRPVSRRKFLRASAVTLGAAALACGGMGCAAQAAPAASGETQVQGKEIETPSFVYGNDTMSKERILVIYATRTGSTVGVASAIGETLGRRGFSVDVKPVQEVVSTAGYQAVVIGSAVNGAHWLPEAVAFVKDHQHALQQAPVALFCVHIMNLGEDEKSKKNRLAYLDEVRALVQPVDEAFFAGMGMNAEEQSGLVRWVYRTFKIGPEGDCRDWDKINGWGQSVSL